MNSAVGLKTDGALHHNVYCNKLLNISYYKKPVRLFKTHRLLNYCSDIVYIKVFFVLFVKGII